ncbi:MAG TPA: deaminase [Candidatus Paceibacterota bacterium]
MKKIDYPYLPAGRDIKYVPADNPFMQEAREYARHNSKDFNQQIGSVVVKDGIVIGRGANDSDYHKTHECERVKRGIPTGQQYELCEGCHPKNHSEPRAIADAKKNGHDTKGADLYLWGHWWACETCWQTMIAAGIKNFYLMEGSEKLFNKSHPKNIIGKQFA